MWRLVYETHEVPAIALPCPWCAHLNWYYSSKPGWFEKNVKVHADGTTYLLRSIICGGCPGHYNVVADPNLERAATSIDIQASRKHLF